MQVLKFAVCKETIAVLRVLLEKALRGDLRGVALCHFTREGKDEVIFTGAYLERPENAIGAALRMKWAATHRLDPGAR